MILGYWEIGKLGNLEIGIQVSGLRIQDQDSGSGFRTMIQDHNSGFRIRVLDQGSYRIYGPIFGLVCRVLPLLFVHPPCCGVDDSGRLLGGSGGARARVRARSPCSLSPGFRRARACWFPSSLALASSALFSSASVSSTSASSLSSASACGFRPWPPPRPRPSFRPASGARVTGWFPAGGCRARGRRALPFLPTLRCRHFPSALLAVTSLALMPPRRPS